MRQVLIVLIALISLTVNAEVKPLAMEGYLGQSTRFRIDSFYDTETELVWGQTTYFKKNGAQSHIQLLGSYIDKRKISGDSIKVFYLTEFVNNKICGHFKFELSWTFIYNGKWYLDKKEIAFRDITMHTCPISKQCLSLEQNEPNGDLMYNKDECLEVYCPVGYSIESLIDGYPEYYYSAEIDKAMLLPKVCQDSITKWLKNELNYFGNGNYYNMVKYWVEKERENDEYRTWTWNLICKAQAQGKKYITYSSFLEGYNRGAPHPQHGGTCVSFDKETGKTITWSDLFGVSNNEAIEGIIKSEMIRQNGEGSFDNCENPKLGSPSIGPYIIDGKICFHFNPYEVGPYSSGMPTCKIDPALLWQFLTPKAILYLSKDL